MLGENRTDQCSLLTHMSGCVTAGVPREPGGTAFLLKERQTSVQETRSRHQRVDLGGGDTTGCNDEHEPTSFTDVCKSSLCKIHLEMFGMFSVH